MSEDKYRVRYMTPRRYGKNLEQMTYLLSDYLAPVNKHLGKDIVIEVVDCEKIQTLESQLEVLTKCSTGIKYSCLDKDIDDIFKCQGCKNKKLLEGEK